MQDESSVPRRELVYDVFQALYEAWVEGQMKPSRYVGLQGDTIVVFDTSGKYFAITVVPATTTGGGSPGETVAAVEPPSSPERVIVAIGRLQNETMRTWVEPLVSELVAALAADTTVAEMRQEIEFLRAEIANGRDAVT